MAGGAIPGGQIAPKSNLVYTQGGKAAEDYMRRQFAAGNLPPPSPITPSAARTPEPSALQPTAGFNVNQAAAGALQQAMMGTQAAGMYRPMNVGAAGYTPATAASRGYGASTIAGAAPIAAQTVQAGQIAGTNLGAYTNPYESQVVSQALGDIERARQIQQNQLGAQATAARAFGGSRQGIAEAETNRAFAQQAAQTAAGLRQSGFQQAQQMAGQDIASRMQAALANQQAGLTAQGQTAANVLAAQQANQAALNQAGQFGATAANQAALANQAAFNQAGQFGASAQNQAMLANQAAQLQANQQRMAAAAQMGGLGQQAFQTGQAISQQQMQQGAMQQALQQALIDAARGQYAGFTGAPAAALSAPLAALGVAPVPETRTTTQQPGLFNYMSMLFGGF